MTLEPPQKRRTTQHIGAAGELLVQYQLLKLGIDSARLTTDAGIDLVVYAPATGAATTMQVKTVERSTPAGGRGRLAGPGNAGKAITLVFTATSLGTALGAPIASITGGAVGWRLVFLAAAALVLIAGALMSFTVPRYKESQHSQVPFFQAIRLPGVFRVALGWALVMLAHFVILTYIDAYLIELGVPEFVTSITLFLIGVGGLVGTLFIGQVSKRSVFAAIVVAPVTVAAGFVVLFLGGRSLIVVLIGVGLWGIGVAAAVVIFQQAILLTGRRAPETATSVGVLLAQGGFAAGSTVGGITIETIGISAIPLVALAFVGVSFVLALTLRPTIHRAEREQAAEELPESRPAESELA